MSDPITRLNVAELDRWGVVGVALMVSLSILGCGSDAAGPSADDASTPVATSLTLSATVLSFSSLGATEQLTATVRDQNGALMNGASVAWASSASTVASVTSTGLVTAVAGGTATVTATSGSATSTAAVTVEQVAASVALSPDMAVLSALGSTERFVAAALDDDGLPLAPQPTFTWGSSDTSVATVDGTGLATAIGNGSAEVTATVGTTSATALVVVQQIAVAVEVTPDVRTLAVGDTATFAAQVRDGRGRLLEDQAVAWASQDTQVATVNEEGLVTAVATGQTNVMATAGQATGSTEVTVRTGWIDIAAGDDHTCAIHASGSVYCWGFGLYGQIGNGYVGQFWSPQRVTLNETGLDVAAGGNQSCALAQDGTAYCWGDATFGQLGIGGSSGGTPAPHVCDVLGFLFECSALPLPVANANTYSALSAADQVTCALEASGEGWCWGDGLGGRLGTGGTGGEYVPARIAGGYLWKSLSVGLSHSCGVTLEGMGYCWGDNWYGSLGDGNGGSPSDGDSLVPVSVSGAIDWASIAAGGETFSCGIDLQGVPYCWGKNGIGHSNLGIDVAPDTCVTQNDCALSPGVVPTSYRFVQITAGYSHVCGLTASGQAVCWSDGTFGALGTGDRVSRATPSPVFGNIEFVQIDAGQWHTCGISADGAAYCWGHNAWGKLGTGNTNTYLVPTRVLDP